MQINVVDEQHHNKMYILYSAEYWNYYCCQKEECRMQFIFVYFCCCFFFFLQTKSDLYNLINCVNPEAFSSSACIVRSLVLLKQLWFSIMCRVCRFGYEKNELILVFEWIWNLFHFVSRLCVDGVLLKRNVWPLWLQISSIFDLFYFCFICHTI